MSSPDDAPGDPRGNPVPPSEETRHIPVIDADTEEMTTDDVQAVENLPAGSAMLLVQRGPDAGARFLLDTDDAQQQERRAAGVASTTLAPFASTFSERSTATSATSSRRRSRRARQRLRREPEAGRELRDGPAWGGLGGSKSTTREGHGKLSSHPCAPALSSASPGKT